MRTILRSAATEPVLVDQALRVLDDFADAQNRGAGLREFIELASRLVSREVGVNDQAGRTTYSAGKSTSSSTVLRRPLAPRGVPEGEAWVRGAETDDAFRMLVLDRLVAALERLDPGSAAQLPATSDDLVRTLLDGTADEAIRVRAAERLAIDLTQPHRAVVVDGELTGDVAAAIPLRLRTTPDGNGRSWAVVPNDRDAVLYASRTPLGAGLAGPVNRLSRSASEAERAIRFSDRRGPGRRAWLTDDLAGLLWLADAPTEHVQTVPDLQDLRDFLPDKYADVELAILEEVAWSPSIRAAAARMGYHHSSIAARIGRLTDTLGWHVAEPPGRLRLQSALLALRLVGLEPNLHKR